MPAEEYYPRPIRYDLYQQDPSAQTVDLLASGAREQIRQGERMGDIKALSEENKWKAIADIPTKLGEGYQRGKVEAREGQRFAEEQAERGQSMAARKMEMEARQKDLADLDAVGPDGKSLRQARIGAERDDMAWNAGRDERYAEEQGFKGRELSMREKELGASLAAQGLTRTQINMEIDRRRQEESDRRLNVELEGIYANVDPNDPQSIAAADAQAQGLLASKQSSDAYGSGMAASARGRSISSKQQGALAAQVARQGTVPYQNMMDAQQKALGDVSALEGLTADRNSYAAASARSTLPIDDSVASGARQRFGMTLASIPGYEGQAESITGMGSLRDGASMFKPADRMTQTLQSAYNQKLQEWNQAKAGMSRQEQSSREVQQVDMRFQALGQQLQQGAAGARNGTNPFTGQQAAAPGGNGAFLAKQQGPGGGVQQAPGRQLINYGNGPGQIPPPAAPAPQEDPALANLKARGILQPRQ